MLLYPYLFSRAKCMCASPSLNGLPTNETLSPSKKLSWTRDGRSGWRGNLASPETLIPRNVTSRSLLSRSLMPSMRRGEGAIGSAVEAGRLRRTFGTACPYVTAYWLSPQYCVQPMKRNRMLQEVQRSTRYWLASALHGKRLLIPSTAERRHRCPQSFNDCCVRPMLCI